MREDDLWRYNQYARRLREYIDDLRMVWNDQAAHDIRARYLQPHQEDAEELDRQLDVLKGKLDQADQQIRYIHTTAPQATELSEKIAEYAQEIEQERQVAYRLIEFSARSRSKAADTFADVQKLIEQANASCASVGGGSTGETISQVTSEAHKINTGAAMYKRSTPATSATYKQVAPNTTYHENGYRFTTNAQGRFGMVNGFLRVFQAPRNNLSTTVGNLGKKGDEGGHAVGTQFYGPSEFFNLFPQTKEMNRGKGSPWVRLENHWKDLMSKGYSVEIGILEVPGKDGRPAGIDVLYEVDYGPGKPKELVETFIRNT